MSIKINEVTKARIEGSIFWIKFFAISFLFIALVIFIMFRNSNYDNGDDLYFTKVSSYYSAYGILHEILYANDTKVMYLRVFNETKDGYYSIDYTPLYNADGTLQVYQNG
jgi:hypothetical protein